MKKAIRAKNQNTGVINSSAGEVSFFVDNAVKYTEAQRDHFCNNFNNSFEEIEVSDDLFNSVNAGQPPMAAPEPEVKVPEVAAETETDLGAGLVTEGFDKLPDGKDYGYTVGYCNFHKIEAASKKHADLLEAVEKYRRAAELGIDVSELDEPEPDEEPESKKEEGADTSEASNDGDGATGASDDDSEASSEKAGEAEKTESDDDK